MRTRLYIVGAGFSKPAGFPLATELTKEVLDCFRDSAGSDHELFSFADHVMGVFEWVNRHKLGVRLGIEEFFFIAEQHLRFVRGLHDLESVGRHDGETAYSASEKVDAWLDYMEEELLTVLARCDEGANLDSIGRFVDTLQPGDVVISFNYDILLERACDARNLRYWLGFNPPPDVPHITIYKLHGSMDWVRPPREEWELNDKFELLYRKKDVNRERMKKSGKPTGDAEYDHELIRIKDRATMLKMIDERDFMPNYWPGLAGLGHRKDIGRVPGLGGLWHTAREGFYNVEEIVNVGFSMSEQDPLARYTFGAFMHYRHTGKVPPPRIVVVSPDASKTIDRYESVFGDSVKAIDKPHQEFDWSQLDA